MMKKRFLYLLLLFLAATGAGAANLGDILSDDSVADADISALEAEAMVFDTVSNGIAITVARCAVEACVPDVSRDELQLLIEKLNNRISVLSGRYQESGDKKLETVLLSYASSRDSYTGFLDGLEAVSPPVEEDTGFPEEDFQFDDDF